MLTYTEKTETSLKTMLTITCCGCYLYLLFYHSPPVCVGFIALLSCHISVSFRMSDLWRQLLAISPVYFLQVCYGMSGAFPAILTPQLTQDCALFTVSDDQESWIGESTQTEKTKLFRFVRENLRPKSQFLKAIFLCI